MDFSVSAPYTSTTVRSAPDVPSHMKILMLGWEYPPHIAGGLGTACQGLTGALSQRGVPIHFVVPQLFGDEQVTHMVLTEPGCTGSPIGDFKLGFTSGQMVDSAGSFAEDEDRGSGTTTMTRIPAFLGPYWSSRRFREEVVEFAGRVGIQPRGTSFPLSVQQALLDGEVYGVAIESDALHAVSSEAGDGEQKLYTSGDGIFGEVERFTSQVLSNLSGAEYDIIHAHDWMTFPAGVALAQLTGKPLVVHVHSLEQDRRGLFVDRNIEAIEKLGLDTASRIIAVSHYTRRAIERFHKIPSKKIRVVHNGAYPRQAVQDYRIRRTWPKRVVLFVGRVTFQKGPDYFVEVATRVIPRLPDVLFVLGGTGDMLPRVKQRVDELGLKEHFLFPGFLSGEELEEMFSIADVYVMPSVSEPFGITALEAISFDTPVILSKQSGVSEVLESALKVDFWDLERMANMIVEVLSNSELRQQLVNTARDEVKHLHWDAAAAKTIEVYEEMVSLGR